MLKETYLRLRFFVLRAGRMIIPICVIFTVLSNIHLDAFGRTDTLISIVGKGITPIFYPLGLDDNNWPATVGLLTGMLAKEVVLGSLSSLYSSLSSQSTYALLQSHFDGEAGAFAYLLFILLYIPCISTMAAIRQEASRKLMYFSISWSLILAYALAVIFYQSMRFNLHPLQSSLWIASMFAALVLFLVILKQKENSGVHYVIANS